ncbi:MAG: hypothetical protein HYY24_09640 [Verrucomicrobia bacterium]|nr:hypothetical protein [Verrucomicrobiota bacterium]
MRASKALSQRRTPVNETEFEAAFRDWANDMRHMLRRIDQSHARYERLRTESRAIGARTRAILDELPRLR